MTNLVGWYPSPRAMSPVFLINDFFSLLEAFEYLTLDLNKVPGQGLGLSIVGRR